MTEGVPASILRNSCSGPHCPIDLPLHWKACQLGPGPASPTGQHLEAKAIDLILKAQPPFVWLGFIKLHCWEIMCHRDVKAVCHKPWPIFLIPCLRRRLLSLCPEILCFSRVSRASLKHPFLSPHLLPCVIYNRPGRKCPFK